MICPICSHGCELVSCDGCGCLYLCGFCDLWFDHLGNCWGFQ